MRTKYIGLRTLHYHIIYSYNIIQTIKWERAAHGLWRSADRNTNWEGNVQWNCQAETCV